MCLYLSLIVNKYLPMDTIKDIVQQGYNNDYSDRVAESLITREVKGKTLTAKPNSYCNRYSLYSLTHSGLDKLCALMDTYYTTFHPPIISHDQLKQLYSLHQKDPLSKHAVSESIAYASFLISSYCIDIESGLEKEVIINTRTGHRATKNDLKGENLVSDIYYSYQRGSTRQVFMEIDMNTERLSGPTGIRKKSIAYASLANRLSCITSHTALQLIYTVHDDEGELPAPKKNGYTDEEIKLLKGRVFHYIYDATLVFAIVSELIPNRRLTITDLIDWLKSKNNLFQWPKNSIHGNLLSILEAVARNVSPYGDYPASCIRSGIEEAHYAVAAGKEERVYEYYSTIYKRRRKSIYKMVCEEGWSNGLLALEGMGSSGIMLGMTLACCPGRFIERHIPFILPDQYFNQQMGYILFNLGLINDEVVSIERMYCLPLRGDSNVNNQGVRIDYFDTYMRCVFQVNELTVCIENISDDIGGFLRAKEYLKLKPSFRPGTVLILLVSDDGILADGSHVEESTLYYKENIKADAGYTILQSGTSCLNKHTFIDYSPNNILQIFQYYCSVYMKMNPSETDKRFLPFMTDVTQDIIMLTYTEFQTATRCEVSSWLILPDSEKVQRGPLPHGCSPIPPAPDQYDMDERPACDWNSILRNGITVN